MVNCEKGHKANRCKRKKVWGSETDCGGRRRKKNSGTERGKRIVERKNVIESDARIMGMKTEDSGRLEEKGEEDAGCDPSQCGREYGCANW